jgi:hypothetical protein
MHLTDKVKAKITRALLQLPNEEMELLPDYEFWPVLMKLPDGGSGIQMMIALFVPVNDQDVTAPMNTIDPYAGQDEYNSLIAELWEAGQDTRNTTRLAVAPGLAQPGARRSQGGLILPQ